MGHQIERQVGAGECHLTRCSCGRSALRIGRKVLLLSAQEGNDLERLFAATPGVTGMGLTLAGRLTKLTDGKSWVDFSPKIQGRRSNRNE